MAAPAAPGSSSGVLTLPSFAFFGFLTFFALSFFACAVLVDQLEDCKSRVGLNAHAPTTKDNMMMRRFMAQFLPLGELPPDEESTTRHGQ